MAQPHHVVGGRVQRVERARSSLRSGIGSTGMLAGLAGCRKRVQIFQAGCDGWAFGFCAFWNTQSAAGNCGDAP